MEQHRYRACITQEGGELAERPVISPKDWKAPPVETTLEITDGVDPSHLNELYVIEREDGRVKIELRGRLEENFSSIILDKDHAELLALFVLRNQRPDGYLLRETRGQQHTRLLLDRAWKGVSTALAAAVRLTGSRRVMSVVPIFTHPRLSLGVIKPGYKMVVETELEDWNAR